MNILFTARRTIFFLLASAVTVFSQSIELKLPANDNSASFDVLKNDSTYLFRLFGDGGMYMRGVLNEGTVPFQNAGVRLMWSPFTASFRSGEVTGAQWNLANTGYHSVAFGFNTIASGDNSFASGLGTSAIGTESAAFGNGAAANGDRSFSINGSGNISTGAIVLGTTSGNNGDDAFAIGSSSVASGLAAIVIGSSVAPGSFGVAIGHGNIAGGNFSVAMGNYASTNNRQGSIVIGDNSTTTLLTVSANNQGAMRFNGGYNLFTNLGLSLGVALSPGANSWSSISDSTRKENFVDADGEYFLSSLPRLRLNSWNYKSQSPEIRHYGPIAQEIFHYFGADSFGTIGNDTTLAAADMDGIMMIVLQALEKRTAELQKKESELSDAEQKAKKLEEKISTQKIKFQEQQDTIEKYKAAVTELMETITDLEKENPAAVSINNK